MNGPRFFGCLLAIGVLMTPTLVAAAGCSFYDNNERQRQSADRGNGMGPGSGAGGSAGGGSAAGGGGGQDKKDDWVLGRIGMPIGDSTKYIDYVLTTPPDVTREGRAMVDAFRGNLGRQNFDQRVVDRQITVAKPIGGTTLGSGIVAQVYTGRR